MAGAEASGLAAVVAADAVEAAPTLLGAELVVGARSGRIVEVEAYRGADDGASHAHRGPTDRNRVMFGPAGRLYVYLIYGMHWCANIVCGPEGEPGAVLVRAIEPLTGVEAMWRDRPKARRLSDLGSGPGKLCAALRIDGEHDGVDLLAPGAAVQLRVGSPPSPSRVVAGPRVGITRATERPWRFVEAGNVHVSRPRPPGFETTTGPAAEGQ